MEVLLERILGSAVVEMWQQDPFLGKYTSASKERETNVNAHYAIASQGWFPWLSWDSDIIKPAAGNRRPDIVFHLRGVHAENFLAIELKRQKYSAAAKADLDKFDADWFRPPYDYLYGASIVLDDASDQFALRLLTRTGPGQSTIRPEFGRAELDRIGMAKKPEVNRAWSTEMPKYRETLLELELSGFSRQQIKERTGEPILEMIRRHYS